jgi:hypothetical protein
LRRRVAVVTAIATVRRLVASGIGFGFLILVAVLVSPPRISLPGVILPGVFP